MSDDFDARTDGSYTFEEEDIIDNRLWAILAYIIFFLPLICAGNSKYARFHSNQGLIITIMGIVASLSGLIPLFGWLIQIFVSLFTAACWFRGIFAAIQGRVVRAWFIGQLNLIKL